MPILGIEIRAVVPPGHLTDEDTAAILGGHKIAYVIAVIDADRRVVQCTDEDAAYVGEPGLEGAYADPRSIPDAGIAEYAADLWTEEIKPLGGMYTVRDNPFLPYGGVNVSVAEVEREPVESAATGYVMASPWAGPADDHFGPLHRYHLTDLIPMEDN